MLSIKTQTEALIKMALEAKTRGDIVRVDLIIAAFATKTIQDNFNDNAMHRLSSLPGELYLSVLRLIIAKASYFYYVDASTLTLEQALLLIKLHKITLKGMDSISLSRDDNTTLEAMPEKNQKAIKAYIEKYNSTRSCANYCCYNCGVSIHPSNANNGCCCAFIPESAKGSSDSSCIIL